MGKELRKGEERNEAERVGLWQRIKLARRRCGVEKQAKEILRICGINGPPVPEDIVGCLRKVTVEYLKWRELSGICEKQEDGWLIVLNENEGKRRQRFTLFHEMKHILDEREGIHCFQKRPSTGQTLDEQIADAFASAILMPRAWVESYWPRHKDTDRMARKFQVGKKEMEKRLRQLRLIGNNPLVWCCTLKIWLKDRVGKVLGQSFVGGRRAPG